MHNVLSYCKFISSFCRQGKLLVFSPFMMSQRELQDMILILILTSLTKVGWRRKHCCWCYFKTDAFADMPEIMKVNTFRERYR